MSSWRAPLHIAALRCRSRAIFLAQSHGHSVHGDVDATTHHFFRTHLKGDWGAVHIGPVAPRLTPGALRCAPGASIAAMRALILSLQRTGARCACSPVGLPSSWPEDVLSTLAALVDWLSVPLAHLSQWSVYAARHGARLCVEVEVREATLRADLEHAASQVEDVACVHVRYAQTDWRARVGGSERASQKLARVTKEVLGPLHTPVIISGRIKHVEDMRRVLVIAGEMPVLVGMTRAVLATPELLDGREAVYCTGCMACDMPPASCHLQLSSQVTAYLATRSGLVIAGASYGTMTCALAAASTGTPTTLYLCGERHGGVMRLRGRVPRQAESMEAVLQRWDECHQEPLITIVRDGQDVLPSHIERLDVRGAVYTGLLPDFSPGAPLAPEGVHVRSALDVLSTGTRRNLCVIFGEDLLAVECALYLKMQHKEVWLVGEHVARGSHPAWAAVYADELKGIVVMNGEAFLERSGRARNPEWITTQGVWRASALEASLPRGVRVPDEYEPMAQRRAMECWDYS